MLKTKMIKFTYKPLPDCLTVAQSDINGLGLYSTQNIKANTILGITHGAFESDIWRTPLGGFINHADQPNCQLVGSKNKFYLKTVTSIMPGTELTVHYSLEQ